MSWGVSNLTDRLRIQGGRYVGYLREGGLAWGLMFTTSRLRLVRDLASLGQTRPRTPHPPAGPGRVRVHDVDAFVDAMRRDGGADGLALEPSDAAAIRAFAEQAECYRRWYDSSRSILFLNDFLDITAECPIIGALERDPALLEIAARYLGAEPVLLGSRMWWSLARPASALEKLKFAQALWHYDLHDYASIKFSFYLTDVVAGGGGTAYIAGSHRRKRLRHQATLFIGRRDDELMGVYGPDAARTVLGPMGAGFAFDPYTFHMGTPPARDRLMLQIEFGRRRYLKNCYANAAPLPGATLSAPATRSGPGRSGPPAR